MFTTRLGGDYWAILQLFLYFILPLGVSLSVISNYFNLTPKFWFTFMATLFGLFLFVPFILALI